MKFLRHFTWFIMFVVACRCQAASAEDQVIDFRYAPRDWQTAICLPDDWQKSLVAKDGSLLYDYPGHGLISETFVALGIANQSWVTQQLVSPRIPIVRTTFRSGGMEIIQEAFSIAPSMTPPGKVPKSVIERIGPDHRMLNWAKPPTNADPAFANIALGRRGPVRYRFEAKPGQVYTVGFGLCEGFHKDTGQRVMDLKIEGKTVRTVDLVADKGQNQPAIYLFEGTDADADGSIELAVASSADSPDKNTILNTLWIFEGTAAANPEELLTGSSKVRPLVHLDCSTPSLLQNPARHDMLTMDLRNSANSEARVIPILSLKSVFPVSAEVSDVRARIGTATEVLLPEPIQKIEKDGSTTLLYFAERIIGPKSSQSMAIAVVRGQSPPGLPDLKLASASKYRAKAVEFWRKLDVPYDRIQVPDAGVQALLNSSIRNIYQAREIKKGMPAFQVGPTRYRGLWVVDGSFLMEAVTFLGRDAEARRGIEYLMSFQRPDGSFMLIDGHYKETGIVLWALTRHARLTGDKAWLRSVWPEVRRGFDYIRQMRNIPPEDAPNARLVPSGYSDGGLSGNLPEYTNIYWTLAGVRAAIDAARWLGMDADAGEWQKEYDDFYATFRRAASRDMQTDSHGNQYLPIRMKSPEPVSPQKAQWAFLHAVFPGKLFRGDDSLVRGNMEMLKATETEGLVRDTGWVNQGLWSYFGSFYAHAWLWLGDGEKASRTLYAFGNHASPLLAWREEQMPLGEGEMVVGDMPHNWASAEFIRLVRHSLVLERGDELHLFEAMPRSWLAPGAITNLKDIITEFGPISLECRVSADGKKATVKIDPPSRTKPRQIVLHLAGTREVSASRPSTTQVELR